jgi:hypothetical protein
MASAASDVVITACNNLRVAVARDLHRSDPIGQATRGWGEM